MWLKEEQQAILVRHKASTTQAPVEALLPQPLANSNTNTNNALVRSTSGRRHASAHGVGMHAWSLGCRHA